MNREILEKIMQIDSKKADAFLASFANEIKDKISRSRDNDEIFKNLELLEEFVYKAPRQALDVVRMIIKDKKFKPKKILKNFYGKEYKDLIFKCLDLLDKIRYIKLPEVFDILVALFNNEDKQIKNEVARVLENLAKFDFYALKSIGYSAQRNVLNIILAWSITQQTNNIEVIKIVAKELLKPEFGGTSMRDYRTMVFHSGVLFPDKDCVLKKIRQETIRILFDLYKNIPDIREKISLLGVLYQASEMPFHPVDIKDIKKIEPIIKDNIVVLVDGYEKILFDKKDRIVSEAPVVQEIERQLLWFNRNHEKRFPKISKLLTKIRRDEPYDLYGTLVGDLNRIEKESWSETEEQRNEKVNKEFKKVNNKNIKEWANKLNLIAEYKDTVDDWKFQNFRGLLFRIAKEKPKIAGKIFQDALDKSKPLKSFVGCFLGGFREGGKIRLWDKYAKDLMKAKDINFVVAILNSIPGPENILNSDVKLLSDIVERKDQFAFLKNKKETDLSGLNYALIRKLIAINKKYEKRVEVLIMKLIRNAKDEEMLFWYFQELGFPAYNGQLNLSKWKPINIKYLLDRLLDIKGLNYEAQLLLLAIAKFKFEPVMNIFIKRIKKREEKGKQKQKWISSLEFDAIPYHLNDELKNYIAEHKKSVGIFGQWISKMTERISIFNIELAQFIQRIGEPLFSRVILKVIQKADELDLNKAADLMWGSSSLDLYNLCFEIVKKTENQKIWKKLKAVMHNTGTVAGEFGIPQALENKAKKIEKHEVKGNKIQLTRAQKFKRQVLKSLRESAGQERQRAQEDLKLRQLEFEG